MKKYEDIAIRPYTHKELMVLYEVSWRTFQHWVKPFEEEIGPKVGHFYNARQVEIIFDKLGLPGSAADLSPPIHRDGGAVR